MFTSALHATVRRDAELHTEVPVSDEPQRADVVLIRRKNQPDDNHNDLTGPPGPMHTLWQLLWPRLGQVTLMEYKSPSRGYRRSDLLRLLGYGFQYYVHYEKAHDLPAPKDMSLVLVVAQTVRALREDAALLELSWVPIEPGIVQLTGTVFPTFIVSADEAAEANDDDWLRLVGGVPIRYPDTMAWCHDWLVHYEEHIPGFVRDDERKELMEMRYKLLESMTPEERLAGLKPHQRLAGLNPEQLPEVLASLNPKQRLAGLNPEQLPEVLAGLNPEQRLAGLNPHEQLLALSDEVLRGLSAEYVSALPTQVQQALHERLARSAKATKE